MSLFLVVLEGGHGQLDRVKREGGCSLLLKSVDSEAAALLHEGGAAKVGLASVVEGEVHVPHHDLVYVHLQRPQDVQQAAVGLFQ